MLNVKALTSAFAVASGATFCILVTYALLVPQGFQSSPSWAPLLPDFRWISTGRFALGFAGAVLAGGLAGFIVATVNNFLQRFRVASH